MFTEELLTPWTDSHPDNSMVAVLRRAQTPAGRDSMARTLQRGTGPLSHTSLRAEGVPLCKPTARQEAGRRVENKWPLMGVVLGTSKLCLGRVPAVTENQEDTVA